MRPWNELDNPSFGQTTQKISLKSWKHVMCANNLNATLLKNQSYSNLFLQGHGRLLLQIYFIYKGIGYLTIVDSYSGWVDARILRTLVRRKSSRILKPGFGSWYSWYFGNWQWSNNMCPRNFNFLPSNRRLITTQWAHSSRQLMA